MRIASVLCTTKSGSCCFGMQKYSQGVLVVLLKWKLSVTWVIFSVRGVIRLCVDSFRKRERVTMKSLDEARKSFGTDEDILLVGEVL